MIHMMGAAQIIYSSTGGELMAEFAFHVRFRLRVRFALAAFVASTIAMVLAAGVSAQEAASNGRAESAHPIPDRLVVLTFDDSAKTHFTVVRPLLLKYRFGATFFITEGWDFATNKKDYMSWDEIKQLHQDGFEIGNHTRDHLAITEKSFPRLSEQLRPIEDRCVQHGIPKPVTFAWPGNARTPLAFATLKEHGIVFARRGGEPEYPYEQGRGVAYEPGQDHPFLLPSAGDARPNWELQDFVDAVEQAKDGKVAVLQFHGVPDTAHDWVSSRADRFEAYLHYLAINDFQVIALKDLTRFVDSIAVPADPMQVIEERLKANQQSAAR